MTTEYSAEMENKTLENSETPSPSSNQLEPLLSIDFEGPKVDLIDFDMLLDTPSTTTDKTGDTQLDSCEKSDCGHSTKRKHIPEPDVSFLDLLDDIFADDTAMEMVNSPLERKDDSFAKPKIYSCRYCPKIFFSNVLCHNHQVRHTKALLQCTWCGKRSRTNSALRRHIQYFHQYSSMCQVFFDSR